MLEAFDRQILRHLWSHGPASRTDLTAVTGQRPNAVGDRTRLLLDAGLLRELPAEARGRSGRPRVPLGIAPDGPGVVGVAVDDRAAVAGRFDLLGRPRGKAVRAAVEPRGLGGMASAAARAFSKVVSDDTLLAGVSATGFVDPAAATLVGASAAVPGPTPVRLASLLRLAQGRPVVLQNDMQAHAAAWRMSRADAAQEDVLLVRLRDGAVGGAMLVNGRPNGGCVAGANELGHTRLAVETPRCYCGGVGCVERVCCTAYLRRLGGRGPLAARLGEPGALEDPAVRRLMELVATGVSNAVNFVRPHRLVLLGELVAEPAVSAAWAKMIVERVLGPIRERLAVEHPAAAADEPANAAAWLALGHLYTLDWPAVAAAPASDVIV